jgi:hypothetical protein
MSPFLTVVGSPGCWAQSTSACPSTKSCPALLLEYLDGFPVSALTAVFNFFC